MALGYSSLDSSLGGQRVTGAVTFDSSYPTGGLAFDVTKIGGVGYAKGVLFLECEPVPSGASLGRTVTLDRATGKLIALDPAGTQVANATDLSAMTIRVKAEMSLA